MNDYPKFLVMLSAGMENPKKAAVALKMAVAAQKRGKQAGIFLLLDGIQALQKGIVETFKVGEPFLSVKESLAGFTQAGGKVFVAKACLKHDGIEEEELLDPKTVVKIDDVLDLIENASKIISL